MYTKKSLAAAADRMRCRAASLREEGMQAEKETALEEGASLIEEYLGQAPIGLAAVEEMLGVLGKNYWIFFPLEKEQQ